MESEIRLVGGDDATDGDQRLGAGGGAEAANDMLAFRPVPQSAAVPIADDGTTSSFKSCRTAEGGMLPPSRGALCVRGLPMDLPSPKQRARGMPGAGLAHGPPAKKMQAAGTTGSAETARHSPRDGWNGCFAFSPVLRAFWPPLRMMLTHQRGISVGMPGPRDLTVRINVVRRHGQATLRHRHAHRIPPQRS